VLYTIPNLDTAGSGAAMLAVARRLDRDRFLPAVCVSERRGTPLEAEVQAAGIALHEVPTTVPARPYHRLPGRVRAVARLVPGGFDLWHSFHYLDDYTEPLVARAAGCRRWLYTKKNMSWGSRAWRARTRLARAVVAQNPTMVDRFFAGRATLIPVGVDTKRFRPGSDPAWRDRLDLDDDEVLVGHVAHLLPNKNQADLVRALAKSAANVHLALAGAPRDEAYAGEVERLVADLGVADRVHLVGPVDDVRPLLHASDLFAFASHEEACPVAVLEAMASGLPVVSTDSAGTRHLVTDGEEGTLVPVGDVGSLAAAIDALAGDPGRRARCGTAARARAEAEHSVDLEAERYAALYASVLEGG
jgi:glycosyltransferase involved in cell wall biosynthesis